MEDAYLIGIRLALDNGVSAGVATIRQELGALDSAITSTAAHLRQLQEIASQTIAVSVPKPPAVVTPPVIQPLVGQDVPGTPSQTPDTAPATAPVANGHSPVQLPDQPPVVTQAAPAAPLSVSMVPASPAGSAVNTASSETRPELIVAPTLPSRTQSAPVSQPGAAAPSQSGSGPADTPRPVTKVIISPIAPAPIGPDRKLPDSNPRPSPVPVSAAPDRAARTASPIVPHAMESLSPVPSAPAAPPPHPVAPQAHAGQPSQAGGDVFLDGTRLGHWLASTLAREAGRPPAGSTSFDPRLGISWPGAQQSGG